MLNYHRERFRKLTLRGIALRQSSDEGLTLETSAFEIFHNGNLTYINAFDKTKLLLRVRCWCRVISGQKFLIFHVDLIGQFSKTLTGVWTKVN